MLWVGGYLPRIEDRDWKDDSVTNQLMVLSRVS
jgi:hypothetical protein